MISVAQYSLLFRTAVSTAQLSWIEEFLELEGLQVLEIQLSRVSIKIKETGDLHEQIVSEVVKALRVLMNTDVSSVSDIGYEESYLG